MVKSFICSTCKTNLILNDLHPPPPRESLAKQDYSYQTYSVMISSVLFISRFMNINMYNYFIKFTSDISSHLTHISNLDYPIAVDQPVTTISYINLIHSNICSVQFKKIIRIQIILLVPWQILTPHNNTVSCSMREMGPPCWVPYQTLVHSIISWWGQRIQSHVTVSLTIHDRTILVPSMTADSVGVALFCPCTFQG